MLIRETVDNAFECITQEHHAFVSGVLAAAWEPTRLDPRLVQTIGLHDTPWRRADAAPIYNAETGLPHDFITFPMDRKVRLYREGLDELEEVDPFAAFLVSRHYTTFSGTHEHRPLTEPESQRRQRLRRLLDDSDARLDDALAWIKFFDIFSLYLCLTGPGTASESVPKWLQGDHWHTAPDETAVNPTWTGDETMSLANWPFAADELEVRLWRRTLPGRFDAANAVERAWEDAELELRRITLVAG